MVAQADITHMKIIELISSLLPEGTAFENLPPLLMGGVFKYYGTSLNQVLIELKKKPFWFVSKGNETVILQTSCFLVWDAAPVSNTVFSIKDARAKEAKFSLMDLKKWRLPERKELWLFAKPKNNPLRSGSNSKLLDQCYWVCSQGIMDLDHRGGELRGSSGSLIMVNPMFENDGFSFLSHALRNDWSVTPTEDSEDNILVSLKAMPDVAEMLLQLDSQHCPLPELEPAQFKDVNKGLWELWDSNEKLFDQLGIRARDPKQDVKDWNIAIDFGTSSTVVAYQEGGQKKLLRIGVKDYWETEQAEHFENPTVLEFVDLPALLSPWQQQAYRPGVQWGDVRCSHEALATQRDNEGDPAITASILGKIKHWALRENNDFPVRISDRAKENKTEMELAPLTLRNPVKGQAIQVSGEDPFDPVELYAWFLGLTINWRQRGLFLRYYMTFPVAYPEAVKDKILASFRRGLQRSLPATLVEQGIFAEFAVEERASEPAAFAAAALPYFDIEPTESGVAYAVFDFGGGTTDFDFGLYREPTIEEEDEGYEAVLDHFGASGDKFLGGENILENLAYLVFQENLDICRSDKIAFTQPLDADDFPGSEMLLENTQAANTNTQMLMARLRPFWEAREQNTSGIEKIGLLNRSGEEIKCELKIDYESLNQFLQKRLTSGVKSFFTAMHKAFSEADEQPAEVHIILAGNASKAPQLQILFMADESANPSADEMEENGHDRNSQMDQLIESLMEASGEQVEQAQKAVSEIKVCIHKLFSDTPPVFRVHLPIAKNENAPYQPTTKTGVALGLLDLCPGSPVKVVNRAVINSQGEAPFDFYVGYVRRRKFKPGLKRHEDYYKWQELGPIREGVFNLVHSQSPQASTGELKQDSPALTYLRLSFSGDCDKHRVFARPMGPAEIEVCSAPNREVLEEGHKENLQRLIL